MLGSAELPACVCVRLGVPKVNALTHTHIATDGWRRKGAAWWEKESEAEAPPAPHLT